MMLLMMTMVMINDSDDGYSDGNDYDDTYNITQKWKSKQFFLLSTQ